MIIYILYIASLHHQDIQYLMDLARAIYLIKETGLSTLAILYEPILQYMIRGGEGSWKIVNDKQQQRTKQNKTKRLLHSHSLEQDKRSASDSPREHGKEWIALVSLVLSSISNCSTKAEGS